MIGNARHPELHTDSKIQVVDGICLNSLLIDHFGVIAKEVEKRRRKIGDDFVLAVDIGAG
jgi:hypothetical protein